jgi:hypothetical protein
MALLPGFEDDGFDVEKDGNEEGSFEVMPPGKYAAIIMNSEVKSTKSGNGSYLTLMFKITEGDYENRTVFANLNLDNPNEKAVAIARRDLTKICKACGVAAIQDSSELHGIPMQITLKVTPATDQFAARNEITNYAPLTDSGEPW